jgi:NAD(P)-dependent dehydrogenase (short-subunit alcohol dehydrogenase family)
MGKDTQCKPRWLVLYRARSGVTIVCYRETVYWPDVLLAAAKQMERQTPQGGAIVAVSSISALVGGGMQTHYTPTKAGVLSLMQSCAVALGKYNIRCNAVLPGWLISQAILDFTWFTMCCIGTIATDINKEDLSDTKKREYMESRTCLGRLGGKLHMISVRDDGALHSCT